MTAALRLPPHLADCPAGIGCVMRLVVPLRVCGEDAEPMRLLPNGRAAASTLPVVGGGTLATQGGDYLGSGVIGKLVSE